MADWQSEDGRVYVKMTDAEIAQLTYKQALEEWHWLNDRIHGNPSFNERMGVPAGPLPQPPLDFGPADAKENVGAGLDTP